MNFSKKNHEHNKINIAVVSKKIKSILIGFLLIPALFLTSCDRGEELGGGTTTPAFTLLKDHMLANQLDINYISGGTNGDLKFVVGAPAEADLAAFLNKFYIIDIRR